MTNGLADPNYDRAGLLYILYCIGPDAKAAVPAIKPLLNSTDPNIRESATYALKSIDPAAVPNSEAK